MGWDRAGLSGRSAAFAVALAIGGCAFDGSGLAESSDAPFDAAAPGDAFVAPCMKSPDYQAGPAGAHRYRRVDEALSYDRARAACAAEGAHLAVVEDDAENDFLRGLGAGDFWIGYDDLDVEGTFAWVTGAAASYENFEGDEPNDNGVEDCVEVRDGGDWNDAGCGDTQGYVCECDPSHRAPQVPACMEAARYDRVVAGRSYRYEALDRKSWPEARQSCREAGAYLAVISDGDENDAIDSFLGGEEAWIGYHDRDREGSFEWVNGSQASFETWDRDQPDDFEGEDCVELVGFSDRWNDFRCPEQQPFVCECDPGANAAR